MKYRLSGGQLITADGIEEKDLLISNGTIEDIVARRSACSSDYRVLDCAGNFISAGFVDIHQHGGGGSDYMDGFPEDYVNATEAHLVHGTTSVMPTLLSASTEAIVNAIRRYKEAKGDARVRANLLGIHIEGPYISASQAGAQKSEHIRSFDEQEYRYVAKVADGHVKRWSVAPEVDGASRFAEFAGSEGIALSIAHSNADFETVIKAYDMGFHHVTHLYSCVSTITRKSGFRVAGVLEAAYYLDDMNVEIIADGCHLPPSLLAYVAKFKSPERIALITDAMRAAGREEGESYLGSREDPLPVIIEDGVAKLTDRSAFGGSIATADRLIRNMIACGVPLPEAVKMVTVNPLRMMNLNVKKGELQRGYDADICVFDNNINIKKVFCNGTLVVSD